MSARQSSFGLFVFAVVIAAARPAAAQELAALRVDPCVPVRAEVVTQQVTLELGPRRPQLVAAPIRLEVSCRGALTVLLSYSTRQMLIRTLNLSPQPAEIREQLLALSLAELFDAHAASDTPLEPPRPVSVEAPATPPVKPPRPPVPSLRLLALSSAQIFSRDPLYLFGGGLGLGWDGPRRVGVFLDFVARNGRAEVPRGTIRVDTANAGLALLYVHGDGRARLRVGASLHGGIVRMRGEPQDLATAAGHTFYGVWLGPSALLGVTLRLGSRALVELAADGGYVAVPITGKAWDLPAVSIAGPFFGLQLGIGLFR